MFYAMEDYRAHGRGKTHERMDKRSECEMGAAARN